jgi:hypothetical protein
MNSLQHHLNEAARWAQRAEGNYARVDAYKDLRCRRTMLAMAEQAELLAERAAALAIFTLNKDEEMRSRDGVHPYRAALFWLLRQRKSGAWSGPKSADMVRAQNLRAIARWDTVRMLAHAFDKSELQVARDLVDTYCALEDGQAAP